MNSLRLKLKEKLSPKPSYNRNQVENMYNHIPKSERPKKARVLSKKQYGNAIKIIEEAVSDFKKTTNEK